MYMSERDYYKAYKKYKHNTVKLLVNLVNINAQKQRH